MTIPFANIPQTLRVPLFFAELDNSKANTNVTPQRALLIGQKTSAGTLVANVAQQSQSQSNSRLAAGPGSILAGMIDAYRANDPTGELWVLPLNDDPGAVAATGSISFTGPTTAAGTLSLYVGGRLIAVPLQSGQTAAQVATTVAAAINAANGIAATAAVDGVTTSKVNLTARNGGECGNDIDIRINYLGYTKGELLPQGLGVTIVAMASGATNPSLTTALTNLGDKPYDFIGCSLTDTASVAAMTALLADATGGRWSWTTQVYGHCWIAKRGTAGTLTAYATLINNQHVTCIGMPTSCPTPPWKWAAGFMGKAAVSLRADPGQPLQYLTVAGILPPESNWLFGIQIQSATLLYGGVSTWTVDGGNNVVMQNIITTYVTNTQGQADDSYLEVETMYQIPYVLRALRTMVAAKYGRKKLADNGTRFGPTSNVVTPNVVRADLIANYKELEADGQVQDADVFAAGLVVERNATNPGRLDILYDGILTNGLRQIALLFQFRLQA